MKLVTWLHKYKWYYPSQGEDGAPSLLEAWEFYEQNMLPRRKINSGQGRGFERQFPGVIDDEPTDLFPIFGTPESSLNQWGDGVSLYFYCLRILGLTLLVIGLCNIPNSDYFLNNYENSDFFPDRTTYTGHSVVHIIMNGLTFVFGSAVCTETKWMPCSDCTEEQWYGAAGHRWAKDKSSGTVFVLRNMCDFDDILMVGLTNLFSIILLILSLILFFRYYRKRLIFLDESIQTASDYSLEIRNPPKDAYDPEIWKSYFDQYSETAHVSLCTILLNNRDLIKALVHRRKLCDKLYSLVPGIAIHNEESRTRSVELLKESCLLKYLLGPLKISSSASNVLRQITNSEAYIRKLQKKKYHVTKVFVTFETMEHLRNSIMRISTASLHSTPDPSTLFSGHVLDVRDPYEPSSIRYMELETGTTTEVVWGIFSYSVFSLIVCLNFWAIKKIFTLSNFWAMILVEKLRPIMDTICEFLTNWECFKSEDIRERSLTFKICLSVVVNQVLVCALAVPFANSLGLEEHDLLPMVSTIYSGAVFIPPFLNIFDPTVIFSRHYKAPRAETRAQMLHCLEGPPFLLSENLANLVGLIALIVYYSALLPNGYFFGSLGCFLTYYSNKFRLLNICRNNSPNIGPKAFGIVMLLTSLIITMSVFHLPFDWSAFPFDNACVDETNLQRISNNYEVTTGMNNVIEIEVPNNAVWVKYCNQNLGPLGEFYDSNFKFRFPFVLPEYQNSFHWMSSDQEQLTTIYGWFSSIFVVIFFLSLLVYLPLKAIARWKDEYEVPEDKIISIGFSFVDRIRAYIPEYFDRNQNFFPLILCNIDHIHERFMGWKDNTRSYDHNNVIFDVPYEGLERKPNIDSSSKGINYALDEDIPTQQTSTGSFDQNPIFSYIKYWKNNGGK